MLLNWILDLILPPRCVNCRVILAAGALCAPCRRRVHLHSTLFCGLCRNRLPFPRAPCHPHFPYLLGAAADYAGPVKSLVHALKFSLVREAGAELGDCLIQYWRRLPDLRANWLIVPIPLSKRRRRERGFNQAEILAERFAAHFGFDLENQALTRVRHTAAQSQAENLAERAKNVAGCFRAEPGLVAGRSILLIDDVVTSGATLLEAARALKRAGAKKIFALVAAKA